MFTISYCLLSGSGVYNAFVVLGAVCWTRPSRAFHSRMAESLICTVCIIPRVFSKNGVTVVKGFIFFPVHIFSSFSVEYPILGDG